MAKTAKPPPAPSAPADANRPVKEIRHRNVRAVIWKNQSDDGRVRYNVTVSRSYRDAQNVWHDTESFPFGELMNLAKALADAHSFISDLEAKARTPNRHA